MGLELGDVLIHWFETDRKNKYSRLVSPISQVLKKASIYCQQEYSLMRLYCAQLYLDRKDRLEIADRSLSNPARLNLA